ncbi:MAG: MlaC/ttg2D family ABC transporter substrate-binding protein [Candidatus Rokuibacteriota bacterium]
MLLAGGPPSAWAGPPSDQLRGSIDRVIRVLEDPELRRASRTAERRAAIRRIANEIFDFAEITRRCLGTHWQARTPDEREEFTRLFADLLERAYIGKLELYSGERVVYLGDAADDEVASVRTRLVTRQRTEIPVEYRMHRRDGRWLVYDVAIEGVSLVANYRAQFNKTIQTASYSGLVERLRAKHDEARAAPPK